MCISFSHMVGHIINLINETHNFCEIIKYTFNIFSEYSIIILDIFMASICLIVLIERKKLKFGNLQIACGIELAVT